MYSVSKNSELKFEVPVRHGGDFVSVCYVFMPDIEISTAYRIALQLHRNLSNNFVLRPTALRNEGPSTATPTTVTNSSVSVLESLQKALQIDTIICETCSAPSNNASGSTETTGENQPLAPYVSNVRVSGVRQHRRYSEPQSESESESDDETAEDDADFATATALAEQITDESFPELYTELQTLWTANNR